MIYDNLIINKNIIRKVRPNFSLHFCDGATVELINGENEKNYLVQMFYEDGNLHYETLLTKGSWAKSGIKYYKEWNIKLFDGPELVIDHKFDLTNKKVFISFDSRSVGDNLAWVPYTDEFRKKHNCDVVVCTFHNQLFEEQYPEITFVEPGTVVNNLYAHYRIGWYYIENYWNRATNPRDFKELPLQQTICDILGLEFKEIKPKLKLNKNISKKKKVGIGIHATCQAKYWNNPTGWQEVTDYLIELGYEVMLYSKESNGHMGNYHPQGITTFTGGSLQDVIDDLQTCEFFIGVGSGLSWVAWASDLPVVLISGFSKPYSEMTQNVFRVFNDKVCNGCFNSSRIDAASWHWCPELQYSERKFECTKKITAGMVIEKINELLETTSI